MRCTLLLFPFCFVNWISFFSSFFVVHNSLYVILISSYTLCFVCFYSVVVYDWKFHRTIAFVFRFRWFCVCLIFFFFFGFYPFFLVLWQKCFFRSFSRYFNRRSTSCSRWSRPNAQHCVQWNTIHRSAYVFRYDYK